jgi:hydroxyacylglutathione hydrolase
MGWAPSLVSPPDGDMGAYMASLSRLQGRKWRQFLPAHGEAIQAPADRLSALVSHRRDREARILAAVRAGADDLAAITTVAYPGLDAALVAAARRNALAHLIDLVDRNLIKAFPSCTPQARWRPC